MTLKDSFIAAAVFIMMAVWFLYLPAKMLPSEDALILFRYAENFAESGIISYNPGGVPIEGSTDFLWMAILAFFRKIGADIYVSSIVLSLCGLLGTACCICCMAGRLSLRWFLLFALFITLLPMTIASLWGFSASFFGLFITLSLYCCIRKKIRLFFICSLLSCLIRPDAIVFIAPLMLFFFWENRSRAADAVKFFLLIFVVPGMLYFIWRFAYFGYPFPLSLYVKQGFALFNKVSLKYNLIILSCCLPLLVFIGCALCRLKHPYRNKEFCLVLLTIGIPFLFYAKILQMQNIAFRFQYPIVLTILAFAAFFMNRRGIKKDYFLSAIIVTSLLFLPLTYRTFKKATFSKYITMHHIADAISELSPRGVLLTTEAGILPYYTKWHTVDAWGLNTPSYAKGVITSQDVAFLSPDIIVMNQMWDYTILEKNQNYPDERNRSWANMIKNMYKGIDKNKYKLYMVPYYLVDSLQKSFFFKLPFIDSEFLRTYNKIFFCFYIKKNGVHYDRLTAILEKNNALSFRQYKKYIGALPGE